MITSISRAPFPLHAIYVTGRGTPGTGRSQAHPQERVREPLSGFGRTLTSGLSHGGLSHGGLRALTRTRARQSCGQGRGRAHARTARGGWGRPPTQAGQQTSYSYLSEVAARPPDSPRKTASLFPNTHPPDLLLPPRLGIEPAIRTCPAPTTVPGIVTGPGRSVAISACQHMTTRTEQKSTSTPEGACVHLAVTDRTNKRTAAAVIDSRAKSTFSTVASIHSLHGKQAAVKQTGKKTKQKKCTPFYI